jgi:hypothetical protein
MLSSRLAMRLASVMQVALVGLAGSLICAGCAGPAKTTSQVAAGLVVVSTQATEKPIDAAAIFPVEPGEARFWLLDDSGQRGESVLIRRETNSQHGASVGSHEGARRSEYLRRDESGAIALTAVLDEPEHALTFFDPPLPVAPDRLKPGEPFESKAAMRVVDSRKPSKQRERGTAARTITYLDDAVIRLPDGRDHRVARIEIRFTADLRMANADERTMLYVSREDGLLASDSTERVTILGTFPRETRRVLVRAQ